MNKENDNTELDELLRSMPKFVDNRSKEEVYNRILQDMAADEKHEKHEKNVNGKGRPRRVRWMPIIISIASVLLLTVLVSSYIGTQQQWTFEAPGNEGQEPSLMQKASEPESIQNNDVSNENGMRMAALDEAVGVYKLDRTDAVFEEDLEGGVAFHFSFLENALSVPVTIIIPKEQIERDFPGMQPSSLDLYQRYADKIDEEALGFDDYHPYKGFFLADGDTLVHYLPADHGYDMASGTSVPYWSSINETFVDFTQLKRVNEDGTPIEWDQVGLLSEPSPLKGKYPRQAYYVYKATNGVDYLAPNVQSYINAEEAFGAIKESVGDLYSSPIPKNIDFQFTEQKTTAIISFNQPLDLSELDEDVANRLIAALALTAGSFGLNLKLENVVQSSWNKYDFKDVLPIPIGPNGYIME